MQNSFESKYALKLIFLKFIFELMIKTAPPAKNSVYGRDVCHCGAVVKELRARADKPGWTPGDAVFCFFLFFCLVSFLTLFFILVFFSIFLLLTLLVMHLDQYILYIFKLKSGVLFWKRDLKSS